MHCRSKERNNTYLNAMISVCEIIHRFKLLIDNAHACFMSADGDFLDILGRFAMLLELCMDEFGGFNGCL